MRKSVKIAIAITALLAVVAVAVVVAVCLTNKNDAPNDAKLEVKVKQPCELKDGDGVDAIRSYISVIYVDGDGNRTEIDDYELSIRGATSPKSGDNTLVVTYTVDGKKLTQTATIFISLVAMPAPEPTLTFVVDGEIIESFKYSPYEDIFEPEVPEKTGYTGAWEEYVLTGRDVTVNAVYTPKQYVVTLDYDSALGGSKHELIDVTYGEPITLPTPEETGYTFVGWYYDETAVADGENWLFDDKNAVLTAKWTTDSYTVTFIADSHTVKACTYTEANKIIDEPTVPTKAGYTGAWEPYTLTSGNVTVYAIYTAIPYTVTFVADAVTVGTQTYTVENKNITPPAVPAKTGYDGTWEQYTLTEGDLTVNATYTAKQYVVTLNYDGATGGNTQQTATVTYDQNVGTLPTPEKTGYNFIGWRYKDVTVTAYTTWTYDVATAEFVAQWSTDNYTVTFVADGKTVAIESYTVENTHVTEPAVPEKTGYIGAWESYTLTSGNVTVCAEYTAITYTVTFVADGTTVDTQTYTVENKNIAEPTVPSKTGYTGAWEAYTLTTGDLTVNAVYTAKKYGVYLFYDGKEYGHKFVTYDQAVGNLSTPEKAGYTFGGWYYDDVEVTAETVWTYDVDDAKLTAKWNIQTYTVTFVAEGGTVSAQTYTVENKNIAEPTVPSKTGYTGAWEAYTLTTGDLTVNATYTAKNYAVTLNYNGATGGNTQQTATVTYDQAVGTLPTPERAGYTFEGWYYNGNAVTSETVWTQDVDGVTFTAQWTQAFYTVKFDNVIGGSVESITDIAYGSKIAEPTPPTHKDYDFICWCTDEDLKNEWNFATDTVTSNMTLYAKWVDFLSYLTFTKLEDYTYSVKVSADGKNAKTIVIPYRCAGGEVTRIESSAFANCYKLTSVTIPDTVTKIQNNAFYQSNNITKVNYEGTLSQWCDIAFGNGNSNPLSAGADLYVNGEKVIDLVIPETLTEVKQYTFYGCTSITSVALDGVTTIGASAFYNCDNLTDVTIPESVTSIGYSAFSGCAKLETVNWNASACTSAGSSSYPIFKSCDTLTTLNIGDGVKSIPSNTFYECDKLTEVEIPASVTKIGTSAFEGCNALAGVHYMGTIDDWCGITFGSATSNPLFYAHDLYLGNQLVTELTIGGTATAIHDYAFYNCTSISSANLGGVESIGIYAFNNCINLASITIPNTVKTIGNYAFYSCKGLTSVTIPDSVTTMGTSVFAYCVNLESITLPFAGASVITSTSTTKYPLGYVFGNSSSFETVTVEQVYSKDGSDVTVSYSLPKSLRNVTITGEKLGYRPFYNCSNLANIEIPNAKTIGSYDFYNCSGLTSIAIPNSATTIGDRAFYGCSVLEEVTIPEGVKTIGLYAFANCTSITSIAIPGTVDTLLANTFYGCTNLTDVTIGNGVTAIYSKCFGNTKLKSIYLPSSIINVEEAFWGCYELENIEVAAGNTHYCIQNGVLYNKDKTYLVRAPQNISGSFVIPSTVTMIAKYAFEHCDSLTQITIGNGVKNIDNYAFESCKNLTSVTIGSGVTNLGYAAFKDCSSLTEVKYAGTVAAWNSMTKSTWNINVPATKVVCSDGEVTL